MWNHFLKSILISWLLLALFACVYGSSLHAQTITGQSTICLNSSQIAQLKSLEPVLIRVSLRLDNSEKLLQLWKGQYISLETQHKALMLKSQEQEQTITKLSEYSESLSKTSEAKDKAYKEDISHYKRQRYEFAIYGFTIGIGVTVATILILKAVK